MTPPPVTTDVSTKSRSTIRLSILCIYIFRMSIGNSFIILLIKLSETKEMALMERHNVRFSMYWASSSMSHPLYAKAREVQSKLPGLG